MEELERVADEAVRALRVRRRDAARTSLERVLVDFERRIDTDTVEFLDRPNHPPERKLRAIRWLHVQNRVLGAYHRYFRLLLPAIRAVTRERADGRPVRLLELGSGSGEMALAMARLARSAGLRVNVEGSDVVPAFVDDANRRARAEDNPARFRVLNAFDLARDLRRGEVDIAFVLQTMHHFSGGQLAKMIAQVGEIGARRFVGADGRRGLFIVGALPALCALSLDPYFTHDAFVSARRFHAEAELDLVGSIAAPDASVVVRGDGPFVSVLEVSYPRREERP